MRHVYRRQSSWSQLASEQPESEQHACIAQFLGIAEHLFSDEYGDLVKSRKEVDRLKTIKEQYLKMLHELSEEILPRAEIGVALTADSINSARDRIAANIKTLESNRDQILQSLQEKISPAPTEERNMVDELANKLTGLESARIAWLTKILGITKRLSELKDYRSAIASELDRVVRLQAAAQLLKPLKVTHCPACDQPVQRGSDTTHCYVCGQEKPGGVEDPRASEKRVDFETEQLKAELGEADDMIKALEVDVQRKERELQSIDEDLNDTRAQLRPVQKAAASILPPEITILDTEKGKLYERLQQLERVKRSLGKEATLNQEITKIQARIEELEEKNAQQEGQVDFETASNILAEGMNTYLDAIQKARRGSWDQAHVGLRLEKRRFKFRIRNQSPSILGGTLRLYFFLAYQYSLMRLSPNAGYNYPGLAVLDYPATMEGTSVADKENFTLEPFIELLEKPEMENTQIIAAGSAFENLEGVNRIELDHAWADE